MAISSARPPFLKRFAVAGATGLVLLHAGLIGAYFAVRWLGESRLWFVDAVGYILPWLFVPSLLLLPATLLLRRSRLLVIVAAVPPVFFLLTYGHLYLPRWPVTTTDPAFTVLTYNVLYRNEDADAVVASIEAGEPDFFGLRELSSPMAQALERRFAERYPYHRVEPGCGFWSRYPILAYEAFQLVEGEGDWAQQLVLDVEGRPVNALSVHPRSPLLRGFHPFGLPVGIPTGFAIQGRDADLRALLSRLEGIGRPLVVIGDLNATDQQSLYASLTRRLHDAHCESGWGMGFTFTRWRNVGLPMWRIDYVLYSPDLTALSAGVGDYGGSDHRPVLARLAFRDRK